MSFKREFVVLIEQICKEEGWAFSGFCDDWVLMVEDILIYGYNFGNNNAAAAMLCGDKAALWEILSSKGIACVEHKFFMNPSCDSYYKQDGGWQQMLDYFKKNKNAVVIKKNDGTGGSGVFAAKTEIELEKAVINIFKTSRALSLCPYYDIEDEYRCIVLNGQIKLAYKKLRPMVIGDGASSVRELMLKSTIMGKCEADKSLNLARVPAKGESVLLNWRHNLGLGSSAQIVQPSEDLSSLAISAAKAVGIEFASVDIINAGGLRVLEINSGIMCEKFSTFNDFCRKTIKNIYKDAICALLNKGEK